MDQIIQTYLEATEFSRTADEVRDAIAGVIQLLDCHSFAYLTLPRDVTQAPYLLSNYDLRWTTKYQAQAYHLRDPVPRYARSVRKLFAWAPEIAARFDSAGQSVFSEAEAFGIRCGITVPLCHNDSTVAAMTFATDVKRTRYQTCLTDNQVAFQFLAQHSHERLKRLQQSSWAWNGVILNTREVECLEWASRGKSRTDIASITGLSIRQVVRDLERIKAKFGVRTTTQAVQIYTANRTNRDTT